MKYCPNCGQTCDDGASFCSKCAAPLDPSAMRAAKTPAGTHSKKKTLVITAVSVVTALMIATVLICIFAGRSVESTAEQFIEAAVKGDYERGVELISPFAFKIAEKDLSEEGSDTAEVLVSLVTSEMREIGENLDRRCGNVTSVKCEIITVRSSSLRNNVNLKVYDPFARSERACDFDILVEVTGSKRTEVYTCKMMMLKDGPNWNILTLSDLDRVD